MLHLGSEDLCCREAWMRFWYLFGLEHNVCALSQPAQAPWRAHSNMLRMVMLSWGEEVWFATLLVCKWMLSSCFLLNFLSFYFARDSDPGSGSHSVLIHRWSRQISTSLSHTVRLSYLKRKTVLLWKFVQCKCCTYYFFQKKIVSYCLGSYELMTINMIAAVIFFSLLVLL